jgi:hypothetical protein
MTPDHAPQPDATPPARGEWAWTLAAAGVVAAFCLVFVLRDREFFWNDDYQTYQLAGYCDAARALMHGEAPLLSPCSWYGGALAGEFQVGVFSVFLMGLAVAVFAAGVPLPYAAATFSIVHLAVLSAGTFRLARTRGLARDLALLAALVASLNGWIFLWGAKQWFPTLASFAWLPWFWWALERALRPEARWRSFLPAGLFLYLLIAAGWPFTVLMALLLSAWLGARTLWQRWAAARAAGRPWRAALLAPWPLAAAWLVGLGLSAPAWLMLAEYAGSTLRGDTSLTHMNPSWMVPLEGWLGLAYPSHLTTWAIWSRPKIHACTEMTGGLVPLAVLAAVLFRRRRAFLAERGWEWGLAAVVVALCVSPGLGNFQYPFRWLPFFFLVVGLLAAHGLQFLRGKVGEAPNFGAWAAVLVLVVWVRTLTLYTDTTRVTVYHGACLLAVCLCWCLIGLRGANAARLRPWMPGLVFLLSCYLMYVNYQPFSEVPTWRIDERMYDHPPLDPGVRYVTFFAREDVIGELYPTTLNRGAYPGIELFPCNTSMYAGVEVVNGYSPMNPRALARVFGIEGQGYFLHDGGDRLLAQEAGPDGMLQLMGVDGLILADRFLPYQPTLQSHGWRPERDVAGGRVFRRDGPPSPRVRSLDEALCDGDYNDAVRLLTDETGRPAPHVLLEPGRREAEVRQFAPADVKPVEDGRNEAAADVSDPSADREALVVFSRPWYPGYVAECDGRPLPVSQLDLTLTAVRLPPGMSGRLTLRYRPRALAVGAAMTAVTAAVLVVVLLLGWLAGRRATAAAPVSDDREESALRKALPSGSPPNGAAEPLRTVP